MKTILIAEDVQLNRELLVQLLEDDYRLLIAVDGEEAVSIALREKPDAILLDLSLPIVDGWEATRRVKSDNAVRHVPVIAVTAHAMQGDEERALASGCDDYISKPIDEKLLLEKLNALLSDGPE